MPRKLPNADETTHVTFSLFPSEIHSIRYAAGCFGSIGKAVQAAVEVLYALRDKKGGMLDLDEADVPPEVEVEEAYWDNRETYLRKQAELKAPMSCNLLPRTERLIAELAEPAYYRHRYWVIKAVEIWLASAMSDEQAARAKKRREQEELKMGPEVRQSLERNKKVFF